MTSSLLIYWCNISKVYTIQCLCTRANCVKQHSKMALVWPCLNLVSNFQAFIDNRITFYVFIFLFAEVTIIEIRVCASKDILVEEYSRNHDAFVQFLSVKQFQIEVINIWCHMDLSSYQRVIKYFFKTFVKLNSQIRSNQNH